MEDYRIRIQAMLKDLIGVSDVSAMEYKQITRDTKREDIDFRKVRGSVRLINPDSVLLPKESDEIIEKILTTDFS